MKKIKFYLIKVKFRSVVFSFLMLSSLPFIGAECDKLVTGGNNSIENLLFTWVLQRQTGFLNDVCPNERLTFYNDHSVISVCPGQDTVRVIFSVSSGILTFLNTGYRYQYTVDNSGSVSRLTLLGQNVGRNLYYNAATSEYISDIKKTELNNNSLKPGMHFFNIPQNEEEIK